jgi:hypothetical protein
MRDISQQVWDGLGLYPRLHWAWVNLPLQPNLHVRLLANGYWILEGFHGVELGRFENEDVAIAVQMALRMITN